MGDEGRPIEKKKHLAELLAGRGKGTGGPADRPPQGSGPPNRHGQPQLPVGQHAVTNWPVLDLGVTPHIERAAWRLTLEGLCERPQTLDWEAFLGLPQVEDVSDFHCVTTWSRMDNRWVGVRFRTLAELCGVRPAARYVLVTGYDQAPASGEHYSTNLALADALQDDVLLVHTWEGAPLPVEHGGPVRMITPRLYAWKGAKWVRSIRFQAEDTPGFWEVRGYSNTADPWQDDRFQRKGEAR